VLGMVADKENTEEKILEAAKEVFLEKGNDGTRMQEIADKAGINKSLLHYYYRNKEKLFASVFKFAFSQFSPRIFGVLKQEDDFFTLIRNFISVYIDIVSKNPFIPLFILNEINKKNTSLFINTVKSAGLNPKVFIDRVQKEIDNGVIRAIDPNQLIVNTIGMCIFPIIGRPMIQVILFDDNKNEYEKFLETRKKEVAEFVINSIKI
jgi:TetR/AcrR family transcriptional regulator